MSYVVPVWHAMASVLYTTSSTPRPIFAINRLKYLGSGILDIHSSYETLPAYRLDLSIVNIFSSLMVVLYC